MIFPVHERFASIALADVASLRGFCRATAARRKQTVGNRAAGDHLGAHPTGELEEVHVIASAAPGETFERISPIPSSKHRERTGAIFVERTGAGLGRLAFKSEVPPEAVDVEPRLGFDAQHSPPSVYI